MNKGIITYSEIICKKGHDQETWVEERPGHARRGPFVICHSRGLDYQFLHISLLLSMYHSSVPYIVLLDKPGANDDSKSVDMAQQTHQILMSVTDHNKYSCAC